MGIINMKKISVIIPMYNVEKVMSRCVQSLFEQTLRDFEVIFVNDCSKDNTLDELGSQLKKHKREDIEVKIISHGQNGGVAVARNTGLDNATGEYIYYVDADDYCDKDTLEVMYSKAKSEDLDVVGCEWMLTFASNARHMVQPDVSTGREAFEKMCYGVMRWNLWLFMVKRSLYESGKFRFIPGANMGEDLMVMMKLLLNAGKVSVIHCPLYHYIQTNSNAMTKNFSAYRHQVTENVEEIERYLEQNGLTEKYSFHLNQLKLNLKLPLIISDKRTDYELWLNWFPESNRFAGENDEQPLRTRFIQKKAAKKRFVWLKLYYTFVVKFVYGVIYK